MTIHIDGIIFSLQRHGGISVYFRELISFLARSRIHSILTLESPTVQEVPKTSEYLEVVRLQSRILERYRHARDFPKSSVFHSSYYRLPEKFSLPSVVTVHDFTYERFIDGPALWVHRHQKNAAIRAAQAIICVSEATKSDLIELVGIRSDQMVYVIPNGVSDAFHPLKNIKYSPDDLLFVGDRRGYKNFRMLLEALRHLDGKRVLCVGGGALREEEFKGLPSSVKERVLHLGYVTDEQLNELYNKVHALVYPSAYEGFGIPVIEAMRAGCPVVSINCKALLEVGGQALSVASSETPMGLADAILRLTSQELRADLVSAGLIRASHYSWNATHDRTLNVYRDLAGS